MGAERAAQIAEMESMGFERSQIELAMRAAFFNSERAIEYLLTVSLQCHFPITSTNSSRVSQKISSTRLGQPLLSHLLLPRLLLALKVAMNRLTCSNVRPRLVQVDVVVLLAAPELEAILLEVRGLEAPPLVDWETSTSYEITPNSSSFDKSCNRTLRCSSLSCNKSVLEIRSWPSSSDNILNSSYSFLVRTVTMTHHFPPELRLSVLPRRSAKPLRG
jgi:hypothetical protein